MNKKYIAPSIRITEVALQSLIALSTHEEIGGGQLGKESDVTNDEWDSEYEEEE